MFSKSYITVKVGVSKGTQPKIPSEILACELLFTQLRTLVPASLIKSIFCLHRPKSYRVDQTNSSLSCRAGYKKQTLCRVVKLKDDLSGFSERISSKSTGRSLSWQTSSNRNFSSIRS